MPHSLPAGSTVQLTGELEVLNRWGHRGQTRHEAVTLIGVCDGRKGQASNRERAAEMRT